MKKNQTPNGIAALIIGILVAALPFSESTALPVSDSLAVPIKTKVARPLKQELTPYYWYLGAEFFSPMIFDDLYSITNERKAKIGQGLQLKLGYRFSPVFGLEAAAGVGQNYAMPNAFQREYWLDRREAYTYYPYTMIDGTVYYHPFTNSNDELLIGEQGKRPENILVEGTPFPKLHSRVRFWQTSLGASINLTRLFYTSIYEEKPVELWMKPGVYLSSFNSKVLNVDTGKEVAVNVNRRYTLGAGLDLGVQFNLNSRWSLDLVNRLVWQRDHAIDGILNAKRAYDAFVWQPAVGLTYKFRKQALEPQAPIPTLDNAVPVPPHASLQLPPLKPEILFELDYWYPERTAPVRARTQTHTAAIYLTFPVNKTYIDPALHNNPQELARIEKEIRTFTDNPNYVVKHIRVEGFASPEGPYANNMRLGQGRAYAIINHIDGLSNSLSSEMFSLGRMTENWSGLRDTLVANPQLPGRDEVLALLDTEKDTERVKTRIKRIKGYADLLKNVYPRLRRSTYTVSYEVRSVDVDTAKDLLISNPETLTADEMYAVAYACGLQTPAGLKALAVLEKFHPQSDALLTYQGIAKLQAKEYAEAERILKSIANPCPEAVNALAVAQAYQGKRDEAMSNWGKILDKLSEARSNFKRLAPRNF